MLKKYLISLTIVASLVLVGCNTESDNEKNTDDNVSNEEQNDVEENNDNELETETENDDRKFELKTHSTETVNRMKEGMDEEVEVVNYEILPYNISYQLDKEFDNPTVEENKIVYSKDDEYNITFEVNENIDLEKAVTNVQEQFNEEEYDMVGEVENTPAEENELKGKVQFFAYPNTEGFYVYEIGDNALSITYQYPVEAGDGMLPLLEDLRKSIKVE